MKTASNTFRVAFYLKKQKAMQAGKPPIYACITVNSKRIKIPLNVSLKKTNGICKGHGKRKQARM